MQEYRPCRAPLSLPNHFIILIRLPCYQETVTQFSNEMWQTDLTYFKIKYVNWDYRSTVLDSYRSYLNSISSEDIPLLDKRCSRRT